MGKWIKENIPRHSAILCNFYNFTDVFYYSGYHFDPFESVENCPMGSSRVLHTDEDFKNFYFANKNIRPLYFLSAEHDYFEYAKSYHPHKFVKNSPVDLEILNSFQVNIHYPYFDIFKYFTARMFVSFPGYMDWFTDFYCDNTKQPFVRNVKTTYVLYKLGDQWKGYLNKISQPEKSPAVGKIPAPVLVESIKNYNIVSYGHKFYGVPQSLGPLDLSKEADRNKEQIIVDNDINSIKAKIIQAIKKNVAESQKQTISYPVPILLESYRKYNIVAYRNYFYGIPRALGTLDISKVEDINREGIIKNKIKSKLIETLKKKKH